MKKLLTNAITTSKNLVQKWKNSVRRGLITSLAALALSGTMNSCGPSVSEKYHTQKEQLASETPMQAKIKLDKLKESYQELFQQYPKLEGILSKESWNDIIVNKENAKWITRIDVLECTDPLVILGKIYFYDEKISWIKEIINVEILARRSAATQYILISYKDDLGGIKSIQENGDASWVYVIAK